MICTGQKIDSLSTNALLISNADIHFSKPKFPSWLNEISREEIYLGISDPFMDKEMALQQAKIRAVAIACLQKQLNYRSIVDNYSSDNGTYASNKFTSITNLHASEPLDLKKVKVLKTFTSAFEEIFTLIQIPKKDTVQKKKDSIHTIHTDVDLFQNQTTGRHNEVYHFIKLSIYLPQLKSLKNVSYNSYHTKTGVDIISKLNHFQLQFPKGIYRYQAFNPEVETEEDQTQLHAPLNYSFWNAYFHLICKHLLLVIKDGSQVKNLSDKYNHIYKNMNRVIDCANLDFTIKNIRVKNNKLYMICDSNQQHKK
jgi:hypothetical protein